MVGRSVPPHIWTWLPFGSHGESTQTTVIGASGMLSCLSVGLQQMRSNRSETESFAGRKPSKSSSSGGIFMIFQDTWPGSFKLVKQEFGMESPRWRGVEEFFEKMDKYEVPVRSDLVRDTQSERQWTRKVYFERHEKTNTATIRTRHQMR